MSKFIIRKVPTGVKFHLTAANGQTIAVSEVYASEAACHRGIAGVCRASAIGRIEDQTIPVPSAPANPKFELYEDRAGLYRFRLRARNGKIIAVSEGYTTKAACLDGIESVMNNAPVAEIMEE